MGEVVPARTSLTLHPPSPPTVHQLLQLAFQGLTFTHQPVSNTKGIQLIKSCKMISCMFQVKND